MTNLISLIEEKATQAINKQFSAEIADPILLQAEITESTQPQFGHYQCNSALKIAKALKINPRQIAKQIAEAIDLYDQTGYRVIEKIEIAGAGWFEPADRIIGKRPRKPIEVTVVEIRRHASS